MNVLVRMNVLERARYSRWIKLASDRLFYEHMRASFHHKCIHIEREDSNIPPAFVYYSLLSLPSALTLSLSFSLPLGYTRLLLPLSSVRRRSFSIKSSVRPPLY